MVDKKINILYKLSDYLISFVLANFGLTIIKKFPEIWPTGIALIIVAFLIVWFSSYTHQINKNEKDIEELKDEFDKLKGRLDLNEKVLNTLRDIVLIRK